MRRGTRLHFDFLTVPLSEAAVAALEDAIAALDPDAVNFGGDEGTPWRGSAVFSADGDTEPTQRRVLHWLRTRPEVLPGSVMVRST